MELDFSSLIAKELSLDEGSVTRTVALLDDEATVPFIARYRKEATGNLDEMQIRAIRDQLQYHRDLQKRKETILKTIEEQGKLTDELKKKIESTFDSAALEDIYLPYKPKRKTRATVAIAKGLEPLADKIWNQEDLDEDIHALATSFVDEEKGVANVDEAWAGARDIVAERINENAELRAELRPFFLETGQVISKVKKGKEKDGANFKDYFDFSEPNSKIPSHRMLAIRRGEKEGFLSYRVDVDRDRALEILRRHIVSNGGTLKEHLLTACEDAYDRLLSPSIEGFARNEMRKNADQEAISVFAKNLRQLLMASPLGGKWILGVDPGIRTGCKLVALDDKGDLLASTVIYTVGSKQNVEDATKIVENYCRRYRIQAIAIGNGTGGRETEAFFRKMDRDQINDAEIVMVNEAGASVYSASEVARNEFPDQDLTVRGAISIGRRLQDPLAELVKIEPKSIGVGQYQHDVDQKELKTGLDDVVIGCVNQVGVELNTASIQLLSYVSGLNESRSKSIINFRKKEGPFSSRDQLLKVPSFGPKTFEQAAGFLRIRNAENPLDRSSVHPERYGLVEQMAADVSATVADLMADAELRKKIDISKYINDEVGEPTLRDILSELEKPGRDPRKKFEPIRFTPGITEVAHLKEGMILEGVVTNITNFGAFVDVGVHQDGLVHVSEISHDFVDDPSKVMEVGQKAKVKVIEVDTQRNRISLSIKQTVDPPARPAKPPQSRPHRQDRRPQGPRRGKPNQRRGGGGPRQDRRPKSQPPAYNPFACLVMEDGKVKIKKDKK